ncbi:MarR family winged helix-turn-helix transcriptional regulator [Ammoniphilus sp. CFH 90114]|uniref:MarR family winged helix-turn-helix transcriptional regulator n=1 Tax=Ammoniphilus sp. CFH 90114 TaxID=2493665 RepID=UPI00100DCE45|nr:MarR family transcriptional regulator [Ammoniphilus sp. CFH 90114]RXT04258.1 MarR family transcriptional regulator [Ammoniphilus sp. CFH 90114]
MERDEIEELRLTVQKFIRLFGLLNQNVTPCGYQLSPSQVFCLQELEHRTLTVGDLAELLLLEKSTVSRLVDGMVKGGFVSRELNEGNRREVLVSLTEKGHKTLNRVREQSIEFYEALLEPLSQGEQQQVYQGFKLMTESLSEVRNIQKK